MGSPLSKQQLDYVSQSSSTRKILDAEARVDANDRVAERKAKNEDGYRKSKHIAAGRLANEWRATGNDRRATHEPTGMLLLDGDTVGNGDLISVVIDGKRVTVRVRYNFSGPLREIRGVYGDDDAGQSYELRENQKAQWEDETEQPEPTGWHLAYKGHQWCVVKGTLTAGEFPELEPAQQLLDVLQAYDKVTPAPDNSVHYRRL